MIVDIFINSKIYWHIEFFPYVKIFVEHKIKMLV